MRAFSGYKILNNFPTQCLKIIHKVSLLDTFIYEVKRFRIRQIDGQTIYTTQCLKITQSVGRIGIFQFWHFPPIFVLLKLTCLVTLFDQKLQV